MSVFLGNIELRHGIILGPMAGVGDASFRKICRSLGAEYTVTEMLSAKALCFEQQGRKTRNTKTADIARISKEEAPCAVQIFGAEPYYMAAAAQMLTSGEYRGYDGGLKPAAIDINMGCPVRKVVSGKEGCALMRNPRLAEKIIRAVSTATTLPVTVKMRAGWDEYSINAPEFAKMAEDAGAAAVCVHARTRKQMYAPGADWNIIKRVKEVLSIPVIGNGDIYSAADAQKMLEMSGCDGVAVARGALGNPWIFSEIAAMLDGKHYNSPSLPDRLALAMRHAEDIIKQDGRVGIARIKSHLAWYIKGVPGAAIARDAIMRADTLEDIRKIFDSLI